MQVFLILLVFPTVAKFHWSGIVDCIVDDVDENGDI